jgi:plastocyanin
MALTRLLRRKTWVGVMLAGLLVLGPATSAQASVLVKATAAHTFKPKKLEINAGTKVVWKAMSGTHTVTAYSKNWSKNTTINTGQTTSFTFRSKGRYKYRCLIHSTLVDGVCSGMCGKVVVG